MAADFPYLYPYTRAEAERRGEAWMHEDSFLQNVCCARDIEQAIRDGSGESGESLREGCVQAVLERYGFKRVRYVLANSLREAGCRYLHSEEALQWGEQTYVPQDGKYNRYIAVDTAAVLLDAFVGQTRQAYQALGLFGPEHCTGDRQELDYTGGVLVLSPNILRESCWTPQNQLWYAHDGFGCSPSAIGRSVRATCLGDGEMTRWNRADFTGVLDEQYLPNWAVEKLAELRNLQQEQAVGLANMAMM